MRKIKREVKEFVTLEYGSDKEKHEHRGVMSAQGYSVYEVKDNGIVVYVRGLGNI